MRSVQVTQDAGSPESLCNHYWLIESPNGPTSKGECKHCGEERVFKNSIQITSWESDGNHAHRSHGVAAPASL